MNTKSQEWEEVISGLAGQLSGVIFPFLVFYPISIPNFLATNKEASQLLITI